MAIPFNADLFGIVYNVDPLVEQIVSIRRQKLIVDERKVAGHCSQIHLTSLSDLSILLARQMRIWKFMQIRAQKQEDNGL